MGVYDLGLTDERFWHLTPKLFSSLLKRHREAQRMANRRAGEVAAAIYSVNRDVRRNPKGFTWLDIFPEDRIEPERPDPTNPWALLQARFAKLEADRKRDDGEEEEGAPEE